ncbi:MotE family protein [Peredibacter sp. HCB2-198]|uniref:MotE family protein n=1 Tax=Peredibacter sp. HCB2-198 TaxID=3383025 RepID=UPI0038B646A6
MKAFLILPLLFGAASALAQVKKTYTEEDFVKKVNEEVKKKVDVIKNKSVSDLTKEILDKEEKVRLRELELQKREDSLKVSENDLGKKYSEFEARQKAFLGCVKRNDEEAKARVGQLVDLISNMKPEKASDVLSIQDPDVAVQILQNIDTKKASKIFNFMDKEVSAKLQKQYLQMKK